MSRFLLDTNAWIAYLKSHSVVVEKVRQAGVQSLFLCAPVRAELWYGACNSQHVEKNQTRLRELFNVLPCLPFEESSADECGELRAVLARQGRPIGPYDLQIAAIALQAKLTVVTRNVGEFGRVPGLSVVNWQDSNP